MKKRGLDFLPGRASSERKVRVFDALDTLPDPSVGDLHPVILGEGKFRIAFALHRPESVQLSDKKIEKNGDRGVIVKIDKGATAIALKEVFSTHASDISSRTHDAFSRRFAYERAARSTFDHFFSGMSLSEKIFLQKVPFSRTMIHELFPSISIPDNAPSSLTVSTLVYLQKKSPDAAFGTSSHELLFRSFERTESLSDADFFRANSAFVDLHGSVDDISQSSGISPEVIEAIRIAQEDEGLRDLLLDVLQRSFAYTSKTGATLDFTGSDNARFYRDDSGEWRMLFLDTYTPKPLFNVAREALRARALGHEITESEVFALIASLNYVRNMHALALALQSPVRFHLASFDTAPLLQNLFPYLQKILSL